METVLLAARNVLRHPRRSALNALTLVVATAVMLIGLAWVAGYGRYVYGSVRDFETGDAQIMRVDYRDEAARLPLDLLIDQSPELRTAVLEEPEIGAASERLSVAARVSSGARGHRVEAVGVEFAHEREVTTIADSIVRGRYPAESGSAEEARAQRAADEGGAAGNAAAEGGPGEGGPGRPGPVQPVPAGDAAEAGPSTGPRTGARAALIGRPVADHLDVEPGDPIYVRATDVDGVEDLIDFQVSGVFELGYAEIDRHRIFLDLETTRRLVRAGGSASRIVLRAADGSVPEDARRAAERLLQERRTEEHAGHPGDGDDSLTAVGWRELAGTVVAAVEADIAMFYLMLGVIFALGLFGMVNSVSVSVRERTREIATLRAIGMRRRAVVRLFALEAAVLALGSVLVAFLLSAPLLWHWGTVGIDIGAHVPPEIPIPFAERFHTVLRPSHVLGAGAFTVLVAVAAAIGPARRAVRLSVAEGLRGE